MKDKEDFNVVIAKIFTSLRPCMGGGGGGGFGVRSGLNEINLPHATH